MSTVSSLTGELAQARESLSRRLQGVDPSDIAAQRRAYDAYAENDPLPEMATMSEIDLGGVSSLGLLPKGCSGDHVILWAHGGGFTMGSSRSHKGVASQVAAAAKVAAIVPDYRLAPEHRHPAALDDIIISYRSILAEGVKPAHIILAGDSAGGGLAVAAALKLKEQGAPMPAGMILLSPWVDLANRGWSHTSKAQRDPFLTSQGLATRAKQYAGEGSANLSILDADLRGLPPTFIQTGEAEILMSDSTALAERLGAAGVPLTLEIWPEMFHVFQARYPMLAQAREAIQRLGQWSAAHMAK
ncbi:MAG: alpha/beta hydrolase [Alphaproteobacteria bacterium]|nr:MAG: alpha/beta hydrolase [Alphaproteobacteria bacterium]